uniref:Uncharacterized protein n=1 Tax=Arundo donax TaxID=35708 RepID=A0A0A8YKD7_ARUDO
MAKGSAARA